MSELNTQNYNESELKKIINNVITIRSNLPDNKLPGMDDDEEPGKSVEEELISLYAQHQFLFDELSERFLSYKINDQNFKSFLPIINKLNTNSEANQEESKISIHELRFLKILSDLNEINNNQLSAEEKSKKEKNLEKLIEEEKKIFRSI